MSSPIEVNMLRHKLWQNNFRPVPVETGEKGTKEPKWSDKARENPPVAVSEWPSGNRLSTGILCDGLVAVDIDVDDPSIASQVIALVVRHLGTAPSRVRSNSSRCLMLYRAVEGEPSKRTVKGAHGAVEVLGKGQQFVAFGMHPSGVAYEWPYTAPDAFSRAALPECSEEVLSGFLEAVAPLLGTDAPRQHTASEGTSHPVLPNTSEAGPRDFARARAALTDELAKLKAMRTGDGRNAALNTSAHSMGTLVGNGSLDKDVVITALYEAATINGHVAKHGHYQTEATIESGMNAGITKPRPLLTIDASDFDISELTTSSIAGSKGKQTLKQVSALSKRSVTLVQGSQIEAKPITWLWDGYLAEDKLTLLAGAGGTGKSTLAFSMAGIITNAGLWPDGSRCNVAGNVLIWSSEDDLADTIKPRLMAVGANESRYGFIKGSVDEKGQSCPFDPAIDIDGLKNAVSSIGGISLLIIDPIVSAITGDMHKANDVRRGLQPIVDFAAEMNCAVLGITHFAKGTAGKNAAERVLGSTAFKDLSRMTLVAAKKEDSDQRVFTRAKSNIGIDTGGFAYTIEAIGLIQGIVATRVVWGEALEGSSRTILNTVEDQGNTENPSKVSQAKQLLLKYLANGPVPAKEIEQRIKGELDLSKNTLIEAKKQLSIESRPAWTQVGLSGGHWVWTLPDTAK